MVWLREYELAMAEPTNFPDFLLDYRDEEFNELLNDPIFITQKTPERDYVEDSGNISTDSEIEAILSQIDTSCPDHPEPLDSKACSSSSNISPSVSEDNSCMKVVKYSPEIEDISDVEEG